MTEPIGAARAAQVLCTLFKWRAQLHRGDDGYWFELFGKPATVRSYPTVQEAALAAYAAKEGSAPAESAKAEAQPAGTAVAEVLEVGSAPNGQAEVVLTCSPEEARKWAELPARHRAAGARPMSKAKRAEPIPCNHLSQNHYTMPGSARQTMTRRQLQETLLHTGGTVLACGEGWRVKSRHIGAGVYDVRLERDR